MKKSLSIWLTISFWALPVLSLSAQSWQYLGQPAPGREPVRFVKAPFLATEQWFWHGVPAFSPDGTEMFFVKYQRAVNRTEIWFSAYESGAWLVPQRAPFSDGTYADNNPKYSRSRDTLFFQSERPASAIYRVTRSGGVWSLPVMLSIPLPAGKHLGKQFSLAKSGNLYAELDNSQGTDMDLYCWQFIDGQYKAASRLASLCSSSLDGFPNIDENERFIIFGSNRAGGFGYFDLYMSCKNQDGSWNQPVNLGDGFNSGTDEAWSNFSPDGRWFFYTTDRPGDAGYNPYWVDAGAIYDRLPKLPYLGLVPPGETPEKFAPDIVSTTGLREYSLTWSSDSTELYFYRFGETTPAKLYVCRFENGSWTAPAEFGPATGHPASEPCMTPDNHRLYFMWNTGESEFPPYYMTERGRTGWTTPVKAGQGMFMSASSAGQLYTTDVSELFSTGRTYLAKIQSTGGLFTRLERQDIQPGYGTQAHPCIAPDGRYILFDIDGGSHLFVSFRKSDGSWDTAIDLVSHGFDAKAGGAVISPDGKYLFFHFNGDIWWVDIRVIENLNPFTSGTAAALNPGLELYQNSPNPFQNQTRIAFSLLKPGNVTLDLYDQTGIKIDCLVGNRYFAAGKHELEINLQNFSPGTYTYTLKVGAGQPLARRMVIAR
ncbi:MAG: T9SS type A sorting domain-containing protein [Bacteroidia bacterium]|nr:T9SS type A sorting domain-containing protein [Bacteroidia bacterium]